MALHIENFMKRQSVLLHRRCHKQPWIISWGGTQNFSMQEGWFPISLFPTIPGHSFGRTLVSLVSPLMRQLLMKKLPVIGIALPAIQHGNLQHGSRGALFLFCWLHHTVGPLEAGNTLLFGYDVNMHHIIYSSLLLWTIAPWLLLSSRCPINAGVAHILPASVLDHIIFISKPATS